MIGKSVERGSGISVLPARNDDDDIYTHRVVFVYAYINYAMMIICSLV